MVKRDMIVIMSCMYYPTKNGVGKKIECWKIIVPLQDNQKKPVPEKIIDSIKSKIISEFGGLTAYNVVGSWKSGEQVFFDKSITIYVDVPTKDHDRSSSFFIKLKDELMRELKQEKIYIAYEYNKSELLSVNEFLRELGFEVPIEQPQSLTQEGINKLVARSDVLTSRLGYKTLRLVRDENLGKILWEREILGIKLKTEIEDNYPKDAVVLSADNLEKYFTVGVFGKPLVIIGDYEYQSYILDKEKQRYIVGNPEIFRQFDDDKEPHYFHSWHGMLRTSEFIPTFVEQVLINYILIRELGVSREEIKITVGSDGSLQNGGEILLICPAIIPNKRVQKVILENVSKAVDMYENGKIDEIALMQAKVKNRYNEKKAPLLKLS